MNRPALQFWDLGDVEVIRYSERSLARVLRGLVAVGGQLLDSHLDGGEGWKPGQTPVLFRVAIPAGKETEFQAVSGFRLSEPPAVSLPAEPSQSSKDALTFMVLLLKYSCTCQPPSTRRTPADHSEGCVYRDLARALTDGLTRAAEVRKARREARESQ